MFVPPAQRRKTSERKAPGVESEHESYTPPRISSFLTGDRHEMPGPSPVALARRFGQQGARMRRSRKGKAL